MTVTHSWQNLETFAKIISVTSTSTKVSSSRRNKLEVVHTFIAIVLLGPTESPYLSLSLSSLCTAVIFIGRSLSKSQQPTTAIRYFNSRLYQQTKKPNSQCQFTNDNLAYFAA
jgi:hypothetical protein